MWLFGSLYPSVSALSKKMRRKGFKSSIFFSTSSCPITRLFFKASAAPVKYAAAIIFWVLGYSILYVDEKRWS